MVEQERRPIHVQSNQGWPLFLLEDLPGRSLETT
jgi:hypothetical protein